MSTVYTLTNFDAAFVSAAPVSGVASVVVCVVTAPEAHALVTVVVTVGMFVVPFEKEEQPKRGRRTDGRFRREKRRKQI